MKKVSVLGIAFALALAATPVLAQGQGNGNGNNSQNGNGRGQGNGGPQLGAPGPVAGLGLPLVAVIGGISYVKYCRRRLDRAEE
jgi:hypothetical protein